MCGGSRFEEQAQARSDGDDEAVRCDPHTPSRHHILDEILALSLCICARQFSCFRNVKFCISKMSLRVSKRFSGALSVYLGSRISLSTFVSVSSALGNQVDYELEDVNLTTRPRCYIDAWITYIEDRE